MNGKDGNMLLIEGKTKRIESVADPTLVRITTKDSLTANDAAIQADLPVAQDKTTQNCNVMHYLKEAGIPVAYIMRNDDTSFISKKCKMIPIECVMRRRAFGSYLKREPSKTSGDIFDPLLTEFFHKHAVVIHEDLVIVGPETEDNTSYYAEMITEDTARELYLKDGQWLGKVYTDPLIEPKKDLWSLYPPKQPRHDMQPLMDMLPEIDMATLEYIRNSLMIPCFEILEKAWKKFNVELIDMKIEIGIIEETKELVIADVIDNDSWRIWPNGDPKQQLDKQAFRDGVNLSEVRDKYAVVTQYTKKF